MALLIASPVVATATVAQSLPRNPQRPMTASTCEEALSRLDEARAGSPLLSQGENRQVLARAIGVAERLCGRAIDRDHIEGK